LSVASAMVLLDPFSHRTAYLVWVDLLNAAVAVAIALSLLVSLDRIYKVRRQPPGTGAAAPHQCISQN